MGLIARFGIINASTIARISSHLGVAIAATLAIFATIHLSAVRWYLLLGAQGQKLPFWRLWNITFASYFIGSTTLGTFGVDGMRLYYIRREKPDSIGQAYLSIVVDRVIGLTGLLAVGFILFAVNYAQIKQHWELFEMVLATAAIGTAVLLAVIFTVGFKRILAPVLQKFRPFHRVTLHIDLLVQSYHNSLPTLALCVLISMVVQTLTLGCLVVLVRALFETPISISQLGLAAVITTIANQIPVTPGGLAVGEGAFTFLCRLLDPASGANDYGSVVFLQRLIALLATVPGLFCYLAFRKVSSVPGRTA